MYFNKLKESSKNPRAKYIAVKKYFDARDSIKEEYVEESFEFAYSMTFGRSGKHRNYRSGGSHRRKMVKYLPIHFKENCVNLHYIKH